MAEHHPDLALADLATSEEHAAASLLSVTAQWSDPTFSAQFDDGTAWVPVTAALPEAGFFAHGVVRACDLVGDGADAAFASALAVVATRADLLLALVVSADHLARGILTLRCRTREEGARVLKGRAVRLPKIAAYFLPRRPPLLQRDRLASEPPRQPGVNAREAELARRFPAIHRR